MPKYEISDPTKIMFCSLIKHRKNIPDLFPAALQPTLMATGLTILRSKVISVRSCIGLSWEKAGESQQ